MSTKKLTRMQIRQIAEEVVDRLVEEHPPEVLGVVRQLLAKRVSKPIGRTVKARWHILVEMARILLRGEEKDPTNAARRVAFMCTGLSEASAVDYLRGQYRKYREILEAEAAEMEKAEPEDWKQHFEAAFAEDVETWDL